MLRFSFRIAGFLALAAAFAALVIDGTRSIAGGAISVTFLGTVLKNWEAEIQRVISSRLHPWLWDPVALEFMRLPLWIVLGALGLLFLLVGQRRAPAAIGYSSRP
jgi:hypothetical protein